MATVYHRGRRIVGALAAAGWVIALAVAARGDEQPADAPPSVAGETAEAYDEFAKWVRQRTDDALKGMTRRYTLDAEQQAAAREAFDRQRAAFMNENGPKVFDLYQRGKALGEMMRRERMAWPEIPVEIRQDLARRALPLMDAMEKHVLAAGGAVSETLSDEQRERLSADTQRMERQLGVARLQIRAVSGQWTDGPPQPATAPAAVVQAPAANLDAWARYVQRFIQRHRLDEVQKVRATDLLADYRARAEKLAAGPKGEPATRPAEQATTGPTQPAGQAATAPTQPADAMATPDAFRARLEEIQTRRLPYNQLFEQLKAELDKIPSEVQRKLAEEDAERSRKSSDQGRAGTKE